MEPGVYILPCVPTGTATPAAARLFMTIASMMEILTVLTLMYWSSVFNRSGSCGFGEETQGSKSHYSGLRTSLVKTDERVSFHVLRFVQRGLYPLCLARSDTGIHFELLHWVIWGGKALCLITRVFLHTLYQEADPSHLSFEWALAVEFFDSFLLF